MHKNCLLYTSPVDGFSGLFSRFYGRSGRSRQIQYFFHRAQVISLHIQIGKSFLVNQAHILRHAAVHNKTGQRILIFILIPVSYTHLDVYKRQPIALEFIAT